MIVKAMAILLALALVAIGIQQWRIHHAHAQLTALQGVANTLHDANLSNQATIRALQAANAGWADKCRADEPEARQQAQLSAQGDSKRQAGVAKSIKSLQATYEHEPTVKAWGNTRVPAAAVRLLKAGDPH